MLRRVLGAAVVLLLALTLVESFLVQALRSELPKDVRNGLTIAVLALSIVVTHRDRRWRSLLTPADLALAGLVALLLAAAVLGEVGTGVTAQAAYVYLRGAVLFYAVRALRPSPKTARPLLLAGTGWAIANAALATVQIALGSAAYTAVGWTDLTAAEIHRGQGFYAHPNELGHLLGLAILVWCLRGNWWVVGALAVGLAATQSRESLLGVAAGLAVIALRRRVFVWPLLALVLVAAVPLAIPGARAEFGRRALGVVAALGIPVKAPEPDASLPLCSPEPVPVAARQQAGKPPSPCRRAEAAQEIRIVYARQGFQLLTGRPLLGYGPGTFGGIVALETDPEWNIHPRLGPGGFRLHGFDGKTVDSFWLHLVVELGLLGLVAYLAWLWLLGRASRPLVAFAVVVAVFSPALEGPLLPPLLFALVGYAWTRCGYPCGMKTTWKAPQRERHGDLTSRSDLPDEVFAFPDKRKEPLTDASHVRNALARFDQVEDVTDQERDLAFANIMKAAKHYDVEVNETDWRELGKPT